MMQEIEAKATESVGMTESNKESLESVSELISAQHEGISSLADGIKHIEQKLQELNQ